jgi:hypothetical protein
MATSLSKDPPEDRGMDWADDNNDDNNDEYVFGSLLSLGKRAPPSAITSASSRYPETPSSQLSQPSGLPVEIIAGLTHDELRRNAEFMKYVALVGSLQELLSLREKKPPSPSPFPHNCESSAPCPFSFPLTRLFFQPHLLRARLHPCAQASQLHKFRLLRGCRHPFLTLGQSSALLSIHRRSSGPFRTTRTTPMLASPQQHLPTPHAACAST